MKAKLVDCLFRLPTKHFSYSKIQIYIYIYDFCYIHEPKARVTNMRSEAHKKQ